MVGCRGGNAGSRVRARGATIAMGRKTNMRQSRARGGAAVGGGACSQMGFAAEQVAFGGGEVGARELHAKDCGWRRWRLRGKRA